MSMAIRRLAVVPGKPASDGAPCSRQLLPPTSIPVHALHTIAPQPRRSMSRRAAASTTRRTHGSYLRMACADTLKSRRCLAGWRP